MPNHNRAMTELDKASDVKLIGAYSNSGADSTGAYVGMRNNTRKCFTEKQANDITEDINAALQPIIDKWYKHFIKEAIAWLEDDDD